MVAGYGSVPVTQPLTLKVCRGEVVTILGPNGAGKTTALLGLAGIARVFAGSGHILDNELGSQPPFRLARRGVAFVPDSHGLHRRLTVVQNLRLRRSSTPLDTTFELFPRLAPLARRRAALLSGGEQRMLALAAALRLGPRLLMVDELSLGLAPQITQQLLAVIRTTCDQTGTSALLVEQHASAVLEVADRAYVMREGAVVDAASGAALRVDPDRLATRYLSSNGASGTT